MKTSLKVATIDDALIAICNMFEIEVKDEGIRIDYDIERNWLIDSYLAGQI